MGVKAGQTLSPLQLQHRVTTSALTHPGVSALWIHVIPLSAALEMTFKKHQKLSKSSKQ